MIVHIFIISYCPIAVFFKTIMSLKIALTKVVICIESLLEHFLEIILWLYACQSGLIKEYFVQLAVLKKNLRAVGSFHKNLDQFLGPTGVMFK